LGARHDDKRVLKKKFEIKWVRNSGAPYPCDQEVDLTLAQFLIDNFGLRNHEMNNDAGKASRDSIDDGGHEGWGQKGIASDAHLAGCGVDQKLDVFDAKSQVIEYGQAAVEQCATVLGWLDPLAVANDKSHGENVLQLRNRFRDRGLRNIQPDRSLGHAPQSHDGLEKTQVAQLEAVSDTINQFHGDL
jgi:hypothetical protein